MNILFTRFPLESAFGGAEGQTLLLAEGLRKKGHTVAFLGSCPTLRERFQVLGFRYQELSIGPPPVTKWGAISFCWRKRGMKRRLIEQVSGVRCQAVFMLSLTEKLLLTDWAVAQGMKVFWIEHDRVGRWLTWNPWLPRLRKLSTLATTIVVSDLSRDLYVQLGWDPKKVVSIPNGIDVEKFAARDVLRPVRLVGRGGQAQHDVFNVGCLARLTHDKGVDLLIQAVTDLPDVHLTIVGDGREKQHLEKLIERKTNNEKQITLLLAVDPAAFYKTIDCCILPSREHDPFGLVAAEAMAAGVPTVVTDACGIARHLTQNEDALIVPAGNVPALRNAIQTLQEFPQVAKKLSERGPVVARERFSKERMVNEYEKLLS